MSGPYYCNVELFCIYDVIYMYMYKRQMVAISHKECIIYTYINNHSVEFKKIYIYYKNIKIDFQYYILILLKYIKIYYAPIFKINTRVILYKSRCNKYNNTLYKKKSLKNLHFKINTPHAQT